MDLIEDFIAQAPSLPALQAMRDWAASIHSASRPMWLERLNEAIAGHDPDASPPDPLAGDGAMLECTRCEYRSNRFKVCRHCGTWLVAPDKARVARRRRQL